ncbi:OsmC family peroxiredoxin [Chryseobacterium joostei]|uniref:Organic hydroperoxide reductase OsmC/OhrA n=1 Tax=Chryseobacterium joostei TaxID=112234 RepID=A0A1N7J5D4_9FLAO|nr:MULTISPECIES: OsmC family protein [Chryseobacterium]AZB01717.1 OsmC family peroxiredoxin [Chryseobacterium joostei]SIS44565.1 Organic hydroperoxide reductase OsmC/OhrA [Chryseobacterium joostei]HCM34252.1 OsmC family peroxiredoxin [Chryseobacterium sp.]
MSKEHHYKTTIQWTGNKGTGTSGYRDYERSHIISVDHKINIEGSSDPSFRGDQTKHNPEEIFISSLSSCHMLWYLHFCSEAGVIVTDYMDEATGIMAETPNGSGHFTEVTLHPKITVADRSMIEKAEQLHHKANEFCFIANSVNFPVKHIPVVLVK